MPCMILLRALCLVAASVSQRPVLWFAANDKQEILFGQ